MSEYVSAKEPIAAAFSTQSEGCCGGGGGAGAQGASSPEERRTAAAGGLRQVLPEGDAGASKRRGRGGCRCWWVALAAVVLIAVVAKS